MSQAVKFFIISVCFIITAQFLSLSFFVLVPTAVASPPDLTVIDIRDKLVVPFGSYNDIGEAKLVPCQQDATKKCWQIPWLAKYIGNMYRYGLIIGSILAVMMIMIGGVMYLIGGLNPAMITRGKEFIAGAITGLALLLGSFILLKTVNPNLINLQPIEVEIIKEEKITMVKMCDELPKGKYILDGENSCGKKVKFKSNDPNVKDEGECIGTGCGNPTAKKKCVPTTPTSTDSYTCRAVLVWGKIYDYEERFLDKVWLYTVSGNNLKDEIYYSTKEDKGQQSYFIYRENVGEEKLKLFNQQSSWVLKVELNDTGYEKQQVTYGSGAADVITKGLNFIGLNGTHDDEFFVGRDIKTPEGADFFTGIWINPECTTCGGAHPTNPGAKPNRGDGWIYDSNCAYFWVGKTLNEGTRLDIDAKNFREDSKIDCSTMDMLDPKGPGYGIGQACGENKQCKSNDCESEGGVQKCECNNNEDCDKGGFPGAVCVKTVATWNICTKGKKTGQDCNKNDECLSKDCITVLGSNNKCDCDNDSECNIDEFCKESTGYDICVQKEKNLNPCVLSSNALANTTKPKDTTSPKMPCMGECVASRWYDSGLAEMRCQCLSDNDCIENQKCIKVNFQCGWNYCINKEYKIPSVPVGYNATTDVGKLANYGLCWDNKDCESGKCEKDGGDKNCAVCTAN